MGDLMRKAILASVLASLALSVGFAVPASAATTGDTTTTLTINATGALAITVPDTADLGSGTPGNDMSGQLGGVTVTDGRSLLAPTWTATAVSTSFTTGGATPAETIPASDVSYWSGAATATTGDGTFTPGQATAGDAVVIATAQTAFSEDGGAGDNSATWNPTIVVAVPSSAVGGIYTGTVTHSVA
jgi:hypothetical protein